MARLLTGFIAFLLVTGSALCVAETTGPQRIVSVGLCTDQLLLMMVDRKRIASVTATATHPEESYMAAAVGDIPLNHGGVEEVMAFDPDLVIGTSYASQETLALLRELGYRVEVTPLPVSLDGVRQLIHDVGRWTGSETPAEAMIHEMDKRLAIVKKNQSGKPQRTIMVYSPNGYTIGRNTLEHEIFTAAGYRNLSAEMGIEGFQTISMEQLVMAQPDFIQIDNYIYNQNSLASSYINHPVLKAMLPEERRLYMPTIWRDCAGPMVVDAIEYLASHR